MIPRDPFKPDLTRCPRCGGTGVVDSKWRLSPTEIEVLWMAAHGLTQQQISDQCQPHRSIQTIKNHLSSAYHKMKVGSLQEAIYLLWLKEHWREPDDYQPMWLP